jgi:hypothetical protein
MIIIIITIATASLTVFELITSRPRVYICVYIIYFIIYIGNIEQMCSANRNIFLIVLPVTLRDTHFRPLHYHRRRSPLILVN